MNQEEMLAIMNAHQNVAKTSYDDGYARGYKDACDKALEILDSNFAPKRAYKRKENGDADQS